MCVAVSSFILEFHSVLEKFMLLSLFSVVNICILLHHHHHHHWESSECFKVALTV